MALISGNVSLEGFCQSIKAWRERAIDVTMRNRVYSGKNKNNKVQWQKNVGFTFSITNWL